MTATAAAGTTAPPLADVVALIRSRVDALDTARPPRVLVDGRSGSGKTTLADALGNAWPDAQVLRLDAMAPGWDGLDAGSRHLLEHVLLADAPRWHEWDWDRDEHVGWHEVDPTRPILVEGSGCLSRANRAESDLGVWIDDDDEQVRRHRALVIRGDGDLYEPHWERWARQERAFFRRERPDLLADLLVPGFRH